VYDRVCLLSVNSIEVNVVYGVGVGIYLVVMLYIGFRTSKIARTIDEFVVAGRRMSLWLTTSSLFATWFCGGTILGGSGTAYSEGIWNTESGWGVIPDPYGAGLCLLIAGLFFMHKLRRMNLLTLSDFYLKRYGKITQTVVSILLISTFIFWSAVQVIAAGKILEAILGWNYELSIIVATIVTWAYTVMGGLWADALTDFYQMLILLIGVVVTFICVLPVVGGLEALPKAIPPEKLQFFPTEYTFNTWLAWIAAWMTIGLGSIPTPDLMQRALGARDEKTAKAGAIISGVMYWTLGSLPVVMGLLGTLLVEKGIIPVEPLEEDPELFFPLLVKYIAPPVIGVIIICGMMAAIMSSADSALLAPATILAKNIGKDVIKPDMSDKSLLVLTRICITILTIASLVIGLTYPYVYELNVFSFDLILAGLFAPLVLGLYWKRTNEVGAIAGMISGMIFRILVAGLIEEFTFKGITYPATWYYYTVFSPIISTIVTIITSLITQKANPPKHIIV